MSRLDQCAGGGRAAGPARPCSGRVISPRRRRWPSAAVRWRLGDAASADLAFARLDRQPRRLRPRRGPIPARARAPDDGQYEEAAPSFGTTTRRAGDELLLALAGAGRDTKADSLATSLLASKTRRASGTRSWSSSVAQNPGSRPESWSTDSAPPGGSRTSQPSPLRGRVAARGGRLARAVARFREAAHRRRHRGRRAGALGSCGGISRAPGRSTRSRRVADTLRVLVSHGQPLAGGCRTPQRAITRVRVAAESGAAGIPQGDLRLFLAAELARDTLAAPRVAGELFRRIVVSGRLRPTRPRRCSPLR